MNFKLGWTCDGTSRHYYGIFLIWPKQNGYETCLLCCGVQPDPPVDEGAVRFRATDIQELLQDQLGSYQKSIQSIDYIGGDNCAVNVKLARNLNLPLVGCASHRLNLAVSHYFENSAHSVHIRKVCTLMDRLTSLKNSSILIITTTI